MKSHGMSGTALYRVWLGMMERCSNPNHKCFSNYGGRGVVVSDDWKSFENFFRDMGATYQSDLTLERKNNSKGYAKNNCRWATRKDQNNNRRNSLWLRTPKGRLTLAQASELFQIARTTLRSRISRGLRGARLFDDARNIR